MMRIAPLLTLLFCLSAQADYQAGKDAQQGGDFARFHAEVRRLAALPADQRRAALDQFQP